MEGMDGMAMAPMQGGDAKPMMAMMHSSFYWGDRAVVLFSGWPGERGAGMYVLCLLFVACLAALAEALAAVSRRVARRGGGAAAGDGARVSSAALLTAAHAARMAVAYLVMLAVMSFNVGVFMAAVAGHALGFLLARSVRRPPPPLAGATAELSGVQPADVSKA